MLVDPPVVGVTEYRRLLVDEKPLPVVERVVELLEPVAAGWQLPGGLQVPTCVPPA